MTRMLLVDPREDALAEGDTSRLPELLDARDLLVVNDAATLPASLAASTLDGEPIEVRLVEPPLGESARAVLFGRGDYRTPTERRPPPPRLAPGASIVIGSERLEVIAVSSRTPRLVTLRWPSAPDARFALIYRAGRPVQYSYEPLPLALWDVQTRFASRPWAVEMPSAARPLDGAMLLALRTRGVQLASLTHAAGLSSTGDPVLDAMLPLPERYEIPRATVQAITRVRERGGRVVAVGTSVVRALEDVWLRHGAVRAGRSTAELVLDAHHVPRVVSGLLTGIHVPGESHYALLGAFAPEPLLARATDHALAGGYRLHERGDAALILPGLLAASARNAA